MLNLILGRNNCDKTEYVRNLVAKKVNGGEGNLIIIVPEQFSFETEKAMLEKVGPKGMLNVEILSLTRLAEVILEECGRVSDKTAVDDGVRMLTMSLALEELSDSLVMFKKHITRPELIANLVSFATELKQCSVTVDMLSEYSQNAEKSSLKSKIDELVLILSMYNAMLDKDYYDTDTLFDVLSDTLNDYDYFAGKTVVIDEFTRFTKQELNVIEKVIKQSEELYITYNTDVNSFNNDFSTFTNINKQIDIIKDLANKCNVRIAKPIVIDVDEKGFSEDLIKLEKNIYNIEKEKYDYNPSESITILSAPNKSSECDYVAQKIKQLMRENSARCKDIIVYERSKDGYDRELAFAFKKYGVPFFEDKRQPIDTQPLIVCLRSLFDIAVNGTSTESIMRFLKTGLTDLSVVEISMLENYAFVWNLRPSQWNNEFVDNPSGFGSKVSELDIEKLNDLNELREKVIAPILAFKRDFNAAIGEEKTAVLYDYLVKFNVRQKLSNLAKALLEQGEEALFEEQSTIWKLVMDMLDKLYLATKNTNVSSKRYFELFEVLLSVSDLGVLPKGLDAVTIGVADRTRTALKKYVFVVGANDGVFPLCPSTQGLLNDNDRITLRNAGIELAQTADYKQIEEQYTAYRALTSAKNKLVVTYSNSSYSGEDIAPSSIITELKGIFTDIQVLDYEQIDAYEKIESDSSAFEILAENYEKNNVVKATINEYFLNKELFKGRIDSLASAVSKEPVEIKDKKIAIDLFGKDLYMSASRTETYHKCPFMYFCQYGLKAEPLKEASIDNSIVGNIIHNAFEHLLKDSKFELINMSDDELKCLVDEILNNYLNDNFGGKNNKTKRFLKQYSAIGNRVFTVLKRIIEELKICDFIPTDFELAISQKVEDDGIPPYEVKIDDESTLKIYGSVDRVDVMEKNGKKYLRVVDYKSNGKKLEFSQVLEGLNTQMLIYLFAILVNGKEKYGDVVPSGVLYMPAKTARSDLSRYPNESDIRKKLYESNCMDGIVLDDMTVIEGMDNEFTGKFIPVTIKDGVANGSLIKEKDFEILKRKIDSILINMGRDLHNGRIEILPFKDKSCTYCEYSSVCRFEEGDRERILSNISNDQALKIIEQEEEETDGRNEME